ncbi:MAG TPA: SRPBCC family protein [Vicinamibacterales bacterium]|nr:SRPBCC family protein [Vicinamibacterales bacterium]
MKRLLVFWGDIDAPIGRATFVANGIGLAVIKYLGGAALIWLATGVFPGPLAYWRALHLTAWPFLAQGPAPWLLPALGAWTLPFVWLGVTLTVRRALDAGLSCWWAFLFFVPYVNYVLMAALALMPTAPPQRARIDTASDREGEDGIPAAYVSVAAGLMLAFLATATLLIGAYGVMLFFASPFAMGAVTAFLYNRRRGATAGETFKVVNVMFLVAAGVMLLFAAEGIICILMALPLALITGAGGAIVGRAIAGTAKADRPVSLIPLLFLPLGAILEPPGGVLLHEVRTSIEINAPPDQVWPHVVAFRPMAEPEDVLFRLGIAYPKYARIEGMGVGAVRYCVFSTGAFVEPITRWEPGRRLSFDVASSPAPLRELTPFENVSPPHLDGYLRSRRGEFRLVPLAEGRTRLEGSTWYEIDMAPEGYWQLFSDYMIGRIHRRVLAHIKDEVES